MQSKMILLHSHQSICQSSSDEGSLGIDSSRSKLQLSAGFGGADFSATVNMGAPLDCLANSDERAHRSSNSAVAEGQQIHLFSTNPS